MKNFSLCVFVIFISCSSSLKLKNYSINHNFYVSICHEIEKDECKCNYSMDNNKTSYTYLSNNFTFHYGQEFIDNPFTVKNICEKKCQKLSKYKEKCDKLKETDPLYQVNKIDLKGIIIEDLSNNSTNVSSNVISLQKNAKIKEFSGNINDCDCLKENDLQSMFCQVQCKSVLDFSAKVNQYYNNLLNTTKEYFEKEKQKFK